MVRIKPAINFALFVVCGLPVLAQPANYIARFQTLGSSFSPAAYCDGGTPQTFLWTWSDNSTSSSFPIATKNFGSAASRFQYLSVSPENVLTKINLGFDGSDDGWTNIYFGTNWPPQNVRAVYFPHPLTNLQYFTASYNPITNTLDFTGFTGLQNVECWHCSTLQHVAVSGLPSLRRVSFEACNLQELDLSNNPNLEDVRGALNAYTSVTLGGGTGPKVWHWCFRDNPQITQDFAQVLTNFYSLQEPWFWNANQSGALKFVSTNLTDVEVFINQYTYADFTGQSNMFECWVFNNVLTNLILTGCTALQTFDAHANKLPSAVLDSLLTQLDNWNPALSFVDLTQNAQYPSYAGYAHYSSLTNRGVQVNLDFPGGATWPVIKLASTALVSETCMPTNNAIDPGETVTVSFALRNTGTRNTGNLSATLLAINGVNVPSGPANYGVLAAGGAAVSRTFTFTATGTCGGILTAVLQLQDSVGNLGLVTVPFQLGRSIALWTQAFDSVIAPALPSGWSTSASGSESPWVTVNSSFDTPPNSAFVPDAANVGLTTLVSPPITLPLGPTQLTFRQRCDLEPAPDSVTGYDGGVLEIKIANNAFTDILTAGGSFVTGGYNRTLSTQFQNPLGGRQAWSGPASTFTNTVVNLPPAAAGQTIQLRWICGTDVDSGNFRGTGWHVDSLAITGGDCCGSPPLLASDSTILVSESCLPTNNAIDPGEAVTVLFALKNLGPGNTTNLVATLLPTNGVISPSGPQTYGSVVASGAAVSRPFTFTAAGICGSSISATLQLQDGATSLGTVSVPLPLGQTAAFFTQNFDLVTAPALPSGWTSSASGGQTNWVTESATYDTAPNAAFAPDAASVGLTALVSPPITLPAGPAQLSFQNYCDLEAASDSVTAYDGGVLDIQIGTNAFTDILAAGGSFLSGGYNRTISTQFQNPLGGRQAWGGRSSSFITTLVNLPAADAGQTIHLRWSCGTDSSNGSGAGNGWFIDSIAVLGGTCCVSAPPPPVIQAISQTNSLVTITWSAVAGHTYRLEFKNNWSDPQWSDLLPDVTAAGPTATTTNAPGPSTQRYYRVLLLP